MSTREREFNVLLEEEMISDKERMLRDEDELPSAFEETDEESAETPKRSKYF